MSTIGQIRWWSETETFFFPFRIITWPALGSLSRLYRSYNSISTRNGPFGRGWTFNYDVQIVVDEARGMTIVEADGFVNRYSPVESAIGPGKGAIDLIVEARKKEDASYLGKTEGKGEAFYKDLRTKLEADPALLKRQTERYLGSQSKVSPSGKYVSHERGTTYLEKTPIGDVRTTETGRKEEYNFNGLLTRVSDRNGNVLTFTYNSESRLDRVTDGCNQWLSFSYTPHGKIKKIADYLLRELTYAYDSDDHLLSAMAADGDTAKFMYDKNHRMTSIAFADGSHVEINYDPKRALSPKRKAPEKR